MKKIVTYSLLIILLKSFDGFAQNKKIGPILSISFHYNRKKAPDTLSVWSFPSGNYWDTSTDYSPKKIGKKYIFSFLPISGPLFFRINNYKFGKLNEIGRYYAEPNDNVQIDIFETNGRDSLVFSGRGASKYELIEQLVERQNHILKDYKAPKINSSAEELNIYFEQYTASILNAIKDKQKLIASFDANINSDIKKLIGYQYANYDMHWNTRMLQNYIDIFKFSSSLKNVTKEYYNSYYNIFFENPEDISVLSPAYYLNLLSKIQIKLWINTNIGYGDANIYYNILKNYSANPKIRERILSQFVMSPSRSLAYIAKPTQATYDSLVRDAGKYLFSQVGKEIMVKKLKLSMGTKFYDSDFIDPDGKTFNTVSLRKKMFLVDLWGTGCKGCAQFHATFEKELWPKLKDNKDFIVLSICSDKKKERWLSSLNSDKYSNSSKNLNVYLGEQIGIDNHPFTKYYGINAIPFLLLVDKNGYIVSKIEYDMDSNRLLAKIKEGLTAVPSK